MCAGLFVCVSDCVCEREGMKKDKIDKKTNMKTDERNLLNSFFPFFLSFLLSNDGVT